MPEDDYLAEARQRVELLSASLPKEVAVSDLGVRSKLPYKVFVVREALIWRTEDVARCACHALERGDLASGTLLARATVESAALIWKLVAVVEGRAQRTTDEMNETLNRLLLGWKGQEGMPEAINIQTMINQIDKRFPVVRKIYDELSEVAHPNWKGVTALFSEMNREKHITRFGRNPRDMATGRKSAIALAMALQLFEKGYNDLGEMVVAWIGALRETEAL